MFTTPVVVRTNADTLLAVNTGDVPAITQPKSVEPTPAALALVQASQAKIDGNVSCSAVWMRVPVSIPSPWWADPGGPATVLSDVAYLLRNVGTGAFLSQGWLGVTTTQTNAAVHCDVADWLNVAKTTYPGAAYDAWEARITAAWGGTVEGGVMELLPNGGVVPDSVNMVAHGVDVTTVEWTQKDNKEVVTTSVTQLGDIVGLNGCVTSGKPSDKGIVPTTCAAIVDTGYPWANPATTHILFGFPQPPEPVAPSSQTTAIRDVWWSFTSSAGAGMPPAHASVTLATSMLGDFESVIAYAPAPSSSAWFRVVATDNELTPDSVASASTCTALGTSPVQPSTGNPGAGTPAAASRTWTIIVWVIVGVVSLVVIVITGVFVSRHNADWKRARTELARYTASQLDTAPPSTGIVF